MSNAKVVTSQPAPAAPPSEDFISEKPSAPLDASTQPMLNLSAGDGGAINENVVLTQPMLNNGNINEMLKQAEEEGARKERTRSRNDFCCFVCADSYADNDPFCWYCFCKMLCNGCGHCCDGIAHCTDACCEGCAECCNNCCNGHDGHGSGGGCDGCCDGHDGGDGCCDGDCDCGDCDCDCNCFD